MTSLLVVLLLISMVFATAASIAIDGGRDAGGSPVPLAQASSWTQLSPTGGPPSARNGHTAVYDSATNRMVAFGGSDGTTDKNDVWVLTNTTGLGGTPAWSQLLATGGPPTARYGHTAAFDASTNRMVVFGGRISGGYKNEVWVLSEASGPSIPSVPGLPVIAVAMVLLLAVAARALPVARKSFAKVSRRATPGP